MIESHESPEAFTDLLQRDRAAVMPLELPYHVADWSAAANTPPESAGDAPRGSARSLFGIRAPEGRFWLVRRDGPTGRAGSRSRMPPLCWMSCGPTGEPFLSNPVDRCPPNTESALEQLVDLGLVDPACADLAINASLSVAQCYRDHDLADMPLNLRIRQRAIYESLRPKHRPRPPFEIDCIPSTSLRIELAPALARRLSAETSRRMLARVLSALKPIDDLDLLECQIPPGHGVHAGPPPGWTDADLRAAIADLADLAAATTPRPRSSAMVAATTPVSRGRQRSPLVFACEGHLVASTAAGIHAVIRVTLEGRISPDSRSLKIRWLRGGLTRPGTPVASLQHLRRVAGLVAGLRASRLIDRTWQVVSGAMPETGALEVVNATDPQANWAARISIVNGRAGWNAFNGSYAASEGLVSAVGHCVDDWIRLSNGCYRGGIGPVQVRMRLGSDAGR